MIFRREGVSKHIDTSADKSFQDQRQFSWKMWQPAQTGGHKTEKMIVEGEKHLALRLFVILGEISAR